jgi:uncharacterized membrane protein
MDERNVNRKKLPHKFDYYVLLFFLLAFIGWLWEVVLFYVTAHAFINRGVYRGPYLPIYGVGGLLLYFLFHIPGKFISRLRKNPLWVFLLSLFICSVLEYMTSYFLEKMWGIRWWDYSSHFMNLNGRICLLGAVVFGLAGTALICLLMPCYDKVYRKLSAGWRIALCLLLLLAFVADATYCAIRPNVGYGISWEGDK